MKTLLPQTAKLVYLAGPISGLDYSGAVSWRDEAIDILADYGIRGLSPMRGKDYLSEMKDLDKNCIEYGEINVMSSPRGIMARDRFDATRCDMLFVNLLGAEKPSLGTVMEIAWADLSRTPVLAVMEAGNVHEHAMVSQAIDFKVGSIAEGLALVHHMLG